MKLWAKLNELDKNYQASRKNYLEIAEKIADVNKRLENLKNSKGEYQPAAYESRRAPLVEEKRRLTTRLNSVKTDFETAAAAMRKDVVEKFGSRYGIRPDAIDSRGLELLRSGALSLDEIKSMSAEYQSNPTMLRLIGTELLKSGAGDDERLFGRALVMESEKQPHLELFDTLCYVGSNALRGEWVDEGGRCCGVDEGIDLSEGTATSVYPETLSRCLAESEAVTTD